MFGAVNLLKTSEEHKDLVHDIAYDFHGNRIATCSSDQSVKVWDRQKDGTWRCSAQWKVHSGSVWRVCWAHPEFGQVLATCSFDRTAIIWEEVSSEYKPSGAKKIFRGQSSCWVEAVKLIDSRSNVTDIQFGPKHLGLVLATCSQNGVLRVYECPDIMNLSQFTIRDADVVVSKYRCSSLSWNPSKYHQPLIAVGCDDPNAPGQKISVFEYSDSRKWVKVDVFESFTYPVYDVEFAPNVGRSYHLLAVASTNLHIFSMKPIQLTAEAGSLDRPEGHQAAPVTNFEVKELSVFAAHDAQVWRVSWNVTGTVLASSGTDGTVKLWKANYMDYWKQVSTIKPGESGLLQETAEEGPYY